jgi:tripartite-type tricarboxylate transporter receptor subunit TctC
MSKKVIAGVVASLALVLTACSTGTSQPQNANQQASQKVTFPTKSVTIIVPLNPGGAMDTTTRIIAKNAEKHLGQSIVLEYKPGGGSAIGQALVAKARPDGYTLLASGPSLISNYLMKKVEFSEASFTPLFKMTQDTDIIVGPAKAPYNDLKTMLEQAKQNPGKVRVGNSGALASDHLSALAFQEAAGIQLNHIPFDGAGPARAALLGGHIELMDANANELVEHVKQGTLTPLAVLSEKRHPLFPDVPTAQEQGINVTMGPWRGLFVPAGTPAEVVTILETAFLKSLQDPETQKQLTDAAIPVDYAGSAEFAKVVKNFEGSYTALAKKHNLSSK